MRYGEILALRIPVELKEKLQRRAEILKVPVATLARWGLYFVATTEDVAGLLAQMGEGTTDERQTEKQT